jgi:hypothetical protein
MLRPILLCQHVSVYWRLTHTCYLHAVRLGSAQLQIDHCRAHIDKVFNAAICRITQCGPCVPSRH